MPEPHPITDHGLMQGWEKIVWIALIVAAVVLHLKSFDEFFLRGHHGWNGSMRTTIALNYLEYELETGGKPWNNYGLMQDPDAQANVFWRHPPGANLLVAASFAVFSDSEATARLVPVVSSLFSLFFILLILRRRYGPMAAIAGGISFLLIPIELEVGRMVNYEAPLLAFALASLECVERARFAQGRRRKVLIGLGLAALAMACAIDWPAYLFAFFLGLDALIRKKREPLIFLLVGVVSVALMAFFMLWLPGEGQSWMQVYEWRGGSRVTFAHVLETSSRRAWLYFGPIPIVLWMAAWILAFVRRRSDPLLVIFSAVGLIYILIFRQATVVHWYYIFYLMPAMVAGCASVIGWLDENVPRKPALFVFGLFFVLLVATNAPRAIDAHWLGYVEKLHQVDDVKKSFPETIRVDHALVGQWIDENTDRLATVAQHTTLTPPSVQMKQYTRRRFLHRASWPRKADIFLARASRLDDGLESRLGQKFGVTRLAGWLIYDTNAPPGVTTLKVVAEPRTWWHDWFVSTTYPPFRVEEDAEASRKYAREFKIEEASQP